VIGHVGARVARWGTRPAIWLAGWTAAVVAAARGYRLAVHGPISSGALALVNASLALLTLAVAAWVITRAVRSPRLDAHDRRRPTTLGSATWGDAAAHVASHGLVLGRDPAGRHALVRYEGDGHLLTLAPTGAGKGVGCVIPTLLTYPGSALVTDPKGENYTVTADRRRAMGHRVLALDPFGVVGGDASFNPLDTVDAAAPDAVDQAAALTELLIVREPRESGDTVFWTEEAKALLTGLILHVATSEQLGRRTLATVWEYLSLPGRGLTQLLTAMTRSPAAGGAVARSAARLRQKGDRVRSGILAQAQSHTHFLESPRLARVMHHSSFAFTDLRRHPVTLHLILPPDRLDVGRRWLRLLVGCALHALVDTRGTPARRPGSSRRHRVLLLLDEFPALGAMPPLERAVSLVRGYGTTCWLLAQDLAQLQALYPASWPTFVANAGVVQAFGTNDLETATYLSAMLGTTTVRTSSHARSRVLPRWGLGGTGEVRATASDTERARALLAPDEVRREDPSTAILLMPGTDPVRVRRLDYRRDREWRGTYAPNPLHGGTLATARS